MVKQLKYFLVLLYIEEVWKNMDSVIWILLGAAVILSGITTYLQARDKKQTELVALVKEQAYQLFLHAEKQDWIGPKKMNWVAEQIIKCIPSDTLIQVIGEERIKNWLQSLYDNFKKSLEN